MATQLDSPGPAGEPQTEAQGHERVLTAEDFLTVDSSAVSTMYPHDRIAIGREGIALRELARLRVSSQGTREPRTSNLPKPSAGQDLARLLPACGAERSR